MGSKITLSCPACNSSSIGEALSIVDNEYDLDIIASYSTCGDCGSFFQNPMPDFKTLSSYYPANYHSFDANNFVTRIKHNQRLKNIMKYHPM